MYIKIYCLFPNNKHSQLSNNIFPHNDKMNSPAIIKSPKNQKGANKPHTPSPTMQPPSQKNSKEPIMLTSPPESPEVFSWLRIFKLADLMMKQGC